MYIKLSDLKQKSNCPRFHYKNQYGDEMLAWRDAWRLWKMYGFDNSPYECPHCKLWHLSTKIKKKVPWWLLQIIKKEGLLKD